MPAGEGPVVAFDGEGGGVIGDEGQGLDGPVGGCLRVFAAVEECGGFARDERDVELVEGNVDAFAPGFDVGFFAGPTVVEGIVLEWIR